MGYRDRLAVCVVYIGDPRRLAVTVTRFNFQSNNQGRGAFHCSTLIGGVLDRFHHNAGDNLPAFTSRRGGAVVDHFSAVGFCSSTGKGARIEIVFHGVTSFVWLICFACQCVEIITPHISQRQQLSYSYFLTFHNYISVSGVTILINVYPTITPLEINFPLCRDLGPIPGSGFG
ncbi:hypothetical protein GECvBMG_gp235 [Salmonella phage GEC_vB_MG]|nr:hypothetical protein GECvBMG_gp235 [Salmonella phage GEC_vB_MG]